MTLTNIINLPTDIYTIIEDYSNIKINTKWIKTKKELRVKVIKYKCGVCKRERQFRQMRIYQDKNYHLITDLCKNSSNCELYCESKNIDWDRKLYEHGKRIDENRAIELFGYHYQIKLNQKRVIRNLQSLFVNIRYHYDEEKSDTHTGYVYNSIYTSKGFYRDERESKLDRLVKLSKLTDSIRKIEGNGILTTRIWSI